ncbi:MAG: hypothetical protein A3C07_04330 [Candidatus Sungbacteria bacterium RIFCSPHIGHO2_02_FULL_47_11]|uniref:Peptide deformylase n=1 Tax=Candidatus Sungbacteria bacterium RIFCSPHIGHO2_02_FULL_47_11 TaxID=1802270 RepID=A0A1G2KQA4_9BACT|nr:MAG: hypothetical protein A3C07_04330 [Candidatus Sungbacteria bacterium RIFCSPHIGHO2_02_FULL_47_11]
MANVQPIVKEPNKVLRKQAREIPIRNIQTPHIQLLVSQMKETLKNTKDGVGLAAPQVGESLRIFIVSEEAEEIDKVRGEKWEEKREEWKKTGEKPYEVREWKYYVFINPVVKKVSRKKLDGPEGCLSVPGKFGQVRRHEKITIESHDEHGKKFVRGTSKFFARVIQHELDHLEGILFIDKTDTLHAT